MPKNVFPCKEISRVSRSFLETLSTGLPQNRRYLRGFHEPVARNDPVKARSEFEDLNMLAAFDPWDFLLIDGQQNNVLVNDFIVLEIVK